jgi:hypothetical protein
MADTTELPSADDRFWQGVRQNFVSALYRHGTAPPAGMVDWVIGEVRRRLGDIAPVTVAACCLEHAKIAEAATNRYASAVVGVAITFATELWGATSGNPPEFEAPADPRPGLRLVQSDEDPEPPAAA